MTLNVTLNLIRKYSCLIALFLISQILILSFNYFNIGSGAVSSQVKIAAVKPSFTAAAYLHDPPAFYDFYDKYKQVIDEQGNVTEDLNYLTSKVPTESSLFHPEIFTDLPTHIKKILPNAEISIIDDSDVHRGAIFKKNNSGLEINSYDILILGVNEYVTQQEYDNLKKFVFNGGTLMVLTGGLLFAEVRYNEATDSVTLVNGHGWNFDGKVAQKGLRERWENETRHWMGSNLYDHYYYENDYNILYNNPFNFTGRDLGEEQYYDKTNPNIKILVNYNSSDPRYPIATYELNYGKGKSIVFGLAAEDIISRPCIETCQMFFRLMDDLILNHAIPSHSKKK
jgi:hypothetical protein